MIQRFGSVPEVAAWLRLRWLFVSVLVKLMWLSWHRVEHCDYSGLSVARDCLAGCADEDAVIDAWQATYGGAKLVARWLPPRVCVSWTELGESGRLRPPTAQG